MKGINMNNIDYIKTKLGRKWRINLYQLYLLCNYYKQHYDKKLRISTHSYRLCEKLGCSTMQLSRIIEMAVNIGLLSICDNKYGFNQLRSGDNKCRLYQFTKEIAEDICTITNTLLMLTTNNNNKKLLLKEDKEVTIDDKDDEEIAPYELPEISFRKRYERGMLPWLYERYPQIREIQSMLSEMNSCLSEEDHWFYTHIIPRAKEKESDKYTFSCRATSEICHLHKESTIPDELVRNDILNDYFGKDKWEEYDLNASIYRIARSCRDGFWYEDSKDIYEELNGSKFASKEERDVFKETCMLVAFTDSINSAYNAYKSKFGLFSLKLSEISPLLNDIKKSINDFCGDIDTDIFLHESYIMTSLAYDLFKRGIKVVQLYDCLFVPKGTARYLDSILSKSFLYYYNTYII